MKKLILLALILLALMISSCNNYSNQETNIIVPAKTSDVVIEQFSENIVNAQNEESKLAITTISNVLTNNTELQTDDGYKIYYGEWEITSVVGIHAKFPPSDEEVNVITGAKVIIDKNYLKFNDIYDDLYCYKYKILEYIIPILDEGISQYYAWYMPTVKELGLCGNYFVFVKYRFTNDETEKITFEFFVKNKNELILATGNAFYLMTRITEINNWVEKDFWGAY